MSANTNNPNQCVPENTEGKSSPRLEYPLDIGNSNEDNKIIAFGFGPYTKERSEARDKFEPKSYVYLPLPSNLSSGHNASYETDTFFKSALTKEGINYGVQAYKDLVDATSGAMESGSKGGITDALEAFGDILQKGGFAKSLSGLDLSASGNASKFGRAIIASEFNKQRYTFGGQYVTNPNAVSTFHNVGFGRYEYSFKLIARNEKESQAIRSIVNTFKYHMLPDSGMANLIFEHPTCVKFHFLPAALEDYLFKPNICAIHNVDVSYNGDSSPKFFKESFAPVEVILNVTLEELEIDTKVTIREKYGKHGILGVGEGGATREFGENEDQFIKELNTTTQGEQTQ